MYVLKKHIHCGGPRGMCEVEQGQILNGWGPYADINFAQKQCAVYNEAKEFNERCACRACVIEQ